MAKKSSASASGVRGSDEFYKCLLDRLDGTTPLIPRNRRNNSRYRYRQSKLAMRVTSKDGGRGPCTPVFSRDLSATGISVLHNGFMHVGTAVEVGLRGSSEQVCPGVVKRCILIGGTTHLIGIQFNKRIQPENFVDSEALLHAECSDLRTTQASVLIVDTVDFERLMTQERLSETGLKLVEADSADKAISLVKDHAPHLIICDLNLGDQRGEEFIKVVRGDGFANPIIAITAENESARVRECLLAGADWVLSRPYSPDELLYTVAQAVRLGGGDRQEPLASLLHKNPQIAELLPKFVEQVKGMVPQVRGAVAEQKLAFLRSLCQFLKGCGTAYGFPLLAAVANEASNALKGSVISQALPSLRRLEWVIRRLDASTTKLAA